MVRFVFRHFAEDERFARRSRNEPSPEIPLTYSYSNHSQDHGQWQVCMCVCACVVVYCVCCVLCCALFLEKYGFKVVRKCKKITGNIGKIIKPRTPFLARFGHPRTEKRSENGLFPQRIVFTFPLGFADDFRRRSYPKRQKRHFLARGPIPKVLIMRLKRS